ncbi:ATP:cob(I)alamin adenosyltransferase [Vulcanibacillus modesticaldus]|uniref:Corrinoid adenosyltransferase n=1 Tax=Vulcanibacillus modesticaldus TaxID=337097 RepID=A0A1D2YSX3_9BACI|nr:cob(I)yrinic acid a,c-diamide adenosyltransferase [Vulcanibacillus modesticaldus]OEF98802.1 ATP:cob(I)alamin adenosyltransferase [Vulcanibacillus modesticaldus]
MSKIYTKTGDKGYTSLTGGKRVRKDDIIVETYGTIDEANSMIGLAVAKINHQSLEKIKKMLIDVQGDLFHVGAEVSTPKGERVYWPLKITQITKLEKNIDELEIELPKLQNFILPGGSEIGAILHVARTIIRRAERLAISNENVIVKAYLNRCSDFLFTAARWVNYQLQQNELEFKPTNH